MNCSNVEFLELSREILEKGETLRLSAVGWSMDPFIRDGEAIHIAPVRKTSLRYGDIILYCSRDKKFFVHRIVKRQKIGGLPAYLVKGDSLIRPDGVVRPQDVLGKVIAIEKGTKFFSLEKKSFSFFNILYTRFLPISRRVGVLLGRCAKKARMPFCLKLVAPD